MTPLTFYPVFHFCSTSSVDSEDEWSLWAYQTLSIIWFRLPWVLWLGNNCTYLFLFLFHCGVLWIILNTFSRLYGNSQTPMIIIKPDLVIKWANSNLVLHRVREHLCVFLRVPASSCIFTFLNIRVIVLESLNMHCVCDCVTGESAAEERHIYAGVWLGMETAIIFLLAEKKKKKSPQTFSHLFSFSSLFSILHSLFSVLPLSFCITYKGSRFLQNEATYGRYANEITARGLEWDTIYPKSWLSIMAGD